jgi:hypothetical protein
VFGDQLAIGTLPLDGTLSGIKGASLLVSAASVASAGPAMPLTFDGARVSLTATLDNARLTQSAGADVLPAAAGLELLYGDELGRLYVVPSGGAL